MTAIKILEDNYHAIFSSPGSIYQSSFTDRLMAHGLAEMNRNIKAKDIMQQQKSFKKDCENERQLKKGETEDKVA